MMKIKLQIDGRACEFYASVTARKGRDAYFLKQKLIQTLRENKSESGESLYTEEITDDLTGFVVEAFDRQFTAQQLLDGYEGWFFDMVSIVDAIMNDVAEALAEGFPKNPTPQPEAKR
jgi:hypothetical protein